MEGAMIEHFSQSEFEKHGAVPAESLAILTDLCRTILEPIRAKFGPLTITSGYRPPDANAATGGVQDSYHIYTADRCAADFVPHGEVVGASTTIETVFNWIRLESRLPIDKVIMECDKVTGKPACIHVQFSRTPRMLAFVGQTHGTGKYTPVFYAPAPMENIEA